MVNRESFNALLSEFDTVVKTVGSCEGIARKLAEFEVELCRLEDENAALEIEAFNNRRAMAALKKENENLLQANRDCKDHFDALMIDYKKDDEFIRKAFLAHPNLDVDVERIE